ncbi:MAG: LpxL/LpxP family Kdo(2)-lipid IV(A) lauroyl/palmitoleoyl acyltransferase [Gammaproteobacteria bacterium]|nr:LpxL/LpxP family Kdo(2)-lipid IV(A) lauroyl/palmitoleoyl acyltransferase [Gammaproteobacteria bacterium]
MKDSLMKVLLKPKYWYGFIVLPIVKLIAILPLSFQIKMGRGIGYLIYIVATRRKKIAKINLKLCFPDMPEDERKILLQENFKLTGLALIETLVCWLSDLKSRLQRTTIEGQEYLDAALDKGNGVILLSYHLTSLETGCCLLSHYYPITGMYKSNKNEFVETLMRRGRLQHLNKLITHSNIRETVKSLKNNEIVWYAPDQNHGNHIKTFAPFFGIQATALDSTSRLAKISNAAVIPFTQKRSSDGKSFHLVIHPPLQGFPTDDTVADATKINQFLEGYLLENTEDYMWLHQKFRTRPNGEKNFYKQIKQS